MHPCAIKSKVPRIAPTVIHHLTPFSFLYLFTLVALDALVAFRKIRITIVFPTVTSRPPGTGTQVPLLAGIADGANDLTSDRLLPRAASPIVPAVVRFPSEPSSPATLIQICPAYGVHEDRLGRDFVSSTQPWRRSYRGEPDTGPRHHPSHTF